MQVLALKKEEEEKRRREEDAERARLAAEQERQRKDREREARLKARLDEEVRMRRLRAAGPLSCFLQRSIAEPRCRASLGHKGGAHPQRQLGLSC